MSAGRTPAIVILPSEHLDALAHTLESVAATLPKADVHVVRAGIPAVDAIADMVGSAGLQVVDARSDTFDAVLGSLDDRFGPQPYCWLFAGERLAPEHAAVLARGGQLASPGQYSWLERPSPLAQARTRAAGAPVRSPRCAELAACTPPASWRMCMLGGLRPAFASFEQVDQDVCTLVHLGELDAAYQRAELSWQAAATAGDRASSVRLARAAVVLASTLGLSSIAVPPAAHWFALEPEPYVAMMYVRVATGSVPFDLLDGLLALVPHAGDVVYRGGIAVEPAERVRALRFAIERNRHDARLRHAAVVRLIEARQATPGEVGAALSLSYLLGRPPASIVDALAAGEQNPLLGDCVNVNLDPAFVAAVIARLHARFSGQAWLTQLVERFLLGRGVDAAEALDAAGVRAYRHRTALSEVGWLGDEVRRTAHARAAAAGETGRSREVAA